MSDFGSNCSGIFFRHSWGRTDFGQLFFLVDMDHSVEKSPEKDVGFEGSHPAGAQTLIVREILRPTHTGLHLEQRDEQKTTYREKDETTTKKSIHMYRCDFFWNENELSRTHKTEFHE